MKKGKPKLGTKELNSSRIRVFLVHDHPILREGFAHLVDKQPDFEVCGQASTAIEAIAELPNARAQLIVLDLPFKGFAGLEAVTKITEIAPDAAVLILSAQDEMLYAEHALRAGAKGYIMKQAPVAEIMTAMRRAASGKRYLSPTMQDLLIERLANGSDNVNKSVPARLSSREMEVFQMIATGRKTSEIAEGLNLSVKTVETYRANIKQKLKLRNGIDLVRAAVSMAAECHVPNGNS